MGRRVQEAAGRAAQPATAARAEHAARRSARGALCADLHQALSRVGAGAPSGRARQAVRDPGRAPLLEPRGSGVDRFPAALEGAYRPGPELAPGIIVLYDQRMASMCGVGWPTVTKERRLWAAQRSKVDSGGRMPRTLRPTWSRWDCRSSARRS